MGVGGYGGGARGFVEKGGGGGGGRSGWIDGSE